MAPTPDASADSADPRTEKARGDVRPPSRLVFRLVGGNEAQMRAWMREHNRALDAAPLENVRTLEDPGRTRDYLRAACALS